ncbi:HNH endonuclease [Rhizobiales bacterium GAS191]|nr:HNH endonuclease [Rhizobiales bacterium GAS191]
MRSTPKACHAAAGILNDRGIQRALRNDERRWALSPAGGATRARGADEMSDATKDGRPRIPAHIRRRVLVEAGHRCAIPSCRHIIAEVHHIGPWSTTRAHRYDNLIALCLNCHDRADRGEIDRKSLRLYKLNLRFAHDKYSQLEMDILFELYKNGQEVGMPWFAFHLILLKRICDSGFITFEETAIGLSMDNLKTNPDLIKITDKGRLFVEKLGLHEL